MRLRFRTRLGLIITVVFVLAGAGLLFGQFFVVQQLFASAIRVTTISCSAGGVPDAGPTSPMTGCSASAPAGEGIVGTGPGQGDMIYGSVIQQSVFLSQSVIGGLLGWSIVLLVVFAVIAAGIAFWLARRSLDRIGEVTKAARAISERDLHRRLDLPGPDDEIKELGDTFDGMLDRLNLAFTAQDRFIANASHELRTPLTTARAALEVPLRHGDVPAALEPAIQRALRATEQSERLIGALLTLARGRAGRDDLELVDVAQLARDVRDDLEPEARARRVRIEPGDSQDGLEALADPILLDRAVRNLVDNGIRHNVRGGHVWVRTLRTGDDIVIEVESTGTNLDAETVALLAEPFYRGAASRTRSDHGGVGLGLAIVDSIATSHGGRLELSAREGGGLRARLVLPTA
jgi:signal transduction histidine kinase